MASASISIPPIKAVSRKVCSSFAGRRETLYARNNAVGDSYLFGWSNWPEEAAADSAGRKIATAGVDLAGQLSSGRRTTVLSAQGTEFRHPPGPARRRCDARQVRDVLVRRRPRALLPTSQLCGTAPSCAWTRRPQFLDRQGPCSCQSVGRFRPGIRLLPGGADEAAVKTHTNDTQEDRISLRPRRHADRQRVSARARLEIFAGSGGHPRCRCGGYIARSA